MDILDKYTLPATRHRRVVKTGSDPFGVRMDEICSATEAIIQGQRTILIGTNNYLGLTFDRNCIAAAVEALRTYGTGTTGSRIANGTYNGHVSLEQAIADFLGRRSAIVFTTGYQANLGTIAGLAGAHDVVLVDADSHASIYDGCKLSGATVIRFRHNDPSDLDRRLARLADKDVGKLVVVEGIYSMVGDRAPLGELVEVKKRHGAYLMVDEAHSLGVLGAHGRGAAEDCGEAVMRDVDFVVGTFSKSLGAVGGFAASDHPQFDVLRFGARSYMYTASASPSTVASVLEALKRMQAQPHLREQLWRNARFLRQEIAGLGFDVVSPEGPIIAVRMPSEDAAVFAWNHLLAQGVYVNLALSPGTPNGLSLLRCSVSAAHRSAQIALVSSAFALLADDLRQAQPAAWASPAERQDRNLVKLPTALSEMPRAGTSAKKLLEQPSADVVVAKQTAGNGRPNGVRLSKAGSQDRLGS